MTHSSRRRRVTLALSVGRARNREQLSSVWPVSNLSRGLIECVGPESFRITVCWRVVFIQRRFHLCGECEIDYILVPRIEIAPVRLTHLKDECVITYSCNPASLRLCIRCPVYVRSIRTTRCHDQTYLSSSKTRNWR